MRGRRILEKLVDPLVATTLAVGYLALLLGTVRDLGYARDEGFYFRAASDYRQWFDVLFREPLRAFDKDVVDRYWRTNHEHPAFVKSLFALSVKFLHGGLGLFKEAATAFRFPGMLLSAVAVATTYLWGRRAISRLAGLVSALLLAMQPAIFYHSHLACFDMAVLSMWLVTTYVYWRSLDGAGGGGLSWALLTGFLYGLALDTKHNAWLMPPAFIVHYVVTRGYRGMRRDIVVGRARAPLALLTMALMGPRGFYALWPWIWFDTGARLSEYVAFHVNHDYYNIEFLGTTYFRPPMPRLYAWVMTAATVPTIALLLFVLGLLKSVLELPWRREVRTSMPPSRRENKKAYGTRVLWLLCILTSYAPWFSSSTPIFGGTKHWITAYPFMCLFAGVGFEWARKRLASLAASLPELVRRLHVPDVVLAASIVAGPVVMTLHAHPWGLSAYVPLVGGAPGGATLGLNRSFWGYTTGAVQDFINRTAKPRAEVYVHDTAMDSWDRLVRDGRIRKDLRGSLTLSATSLGVYHHEQHMAKVEYQYWVDYGTVQPATVAGLDGVPIVWVYVRPDGPPDGKPAM